MYYFDRLKEFWTQSVDFDENQLKRLNIEFNSPFNYAIYTLVHRFLNANDGPSFIEVPIKELGSSNYSENYKNFCSAVLLAAVDYALQDELRKDLVEPIERGDYFVTSRGDFRIWHGEKRNLPGEYIATSIDNNGGRNNTHYTYNNPLSAVKLFRQYDYRNTRTEKRNFNRWKDWLINSGKIEENSFVIGSKIRILIISHSEMNNVDVLNIIPNCSIGQNGNIQYSSPLAPFIFLVNNPSVVQVQNLVEENYFHAVIMLGDDKITTQGVWNFANGYFKKIIFIASKGPYMNNAYGNRYFTFATNELHEYYGMREQIQFEIKIAKDNNLEDRLRDFHEELMAIDPDLPINFRQFREITAEISESQENWFLDYFNQKIIANGTIDLDYSDLEEKFRGIINYLKENGNPSKIRAFNEIRNNLGRGRQNDIIAIVANKYEIEQLSTQLGIDESRILPKKNFTRRLRPLLESERSKTIIFFSTPYTYEGSILQTLDYYSVPGNRIFIRQSENDSLVGNLLEQRKNSNLERLINTNREIITNIPLETDGMFDDLEQFDRFETIYDLEITEFENFTQPLNAVEREFYSIRLDENEEVFQLSGSVVNKTEDEFEFIDLSEVQEGNLILFYKNDADIFTEIFSEYYPGFNEDIQRYSDMVKEFVREIFNLNNNNIEDLEKNLIDCGLKTNFNSLQGYCRENDTTLFPRIDTLKALRNYGQRFCNNNPTFLTEYDNCLRAKKAVELKKQVGVRLSSALLNASCGFSMEDERLKEIFNENAGLLERSLSQCIIKGKVGEIKLNN